MFNKIVDVLKEVFWIKPSHRKAKPSRPKKKSAVKKKVVKKKAAPKVKAKAVPVVKKAAKAVVKASKAPKAPAIDPSLVEIGEITHYFDRIKVCVVKVNQGSVLIGDKLTIFGPKTKFTQKVWSLQIESLDVKVAKKGQLAGLKVDKPVSVGDRVYK